MLKKIVKAFLPKKLKDDLVFLRNNYFDGYALKSYSQEGEDMILRRLFEVQKTGFYVDVGAHHPKRFSNTYFFYKQGWKGINIDAMPGSMKLFNKFRPRDINIEIPISDEKETLTYYIFNEPALNTFSKELTKERDGKKSYFVESTKDIETSTLTNVLNDYLPLNQNIDFLTIDVEGWDFKVLKSIDFSKYRPRVILIEVLATSLADIEKEHTTNYLLSLGYSFYAKSINTVFFIDNNEFSR